MTSHLTGDFSDPMGLHGKGLGAVMGFVGLTKVRRGQELAPWPRKPHSAGSEMDLLPP